MTMFAPDLANDPRAVRVRKKPLPVSVTFAERAGRCATLEGDVGYRAGDAILSGIENERWPIERKLFLKHYRPCPPTLEGKDGIYISRAVEARAIRIDRPIRIVVGPGEDPLVGNVGDWLVRYSYGGYGIVRPSIFSSTYKILDPEPALP